MKKKTVLFFTFLIMLCLGSVVTAKLLYATEGNQIYAPKTLIDIKWGLEPEDFGLVDMKGVEIPPIGPLTFSLDKNGNIYIFDSVKKHIKKFSSEGYYQGKLGSDISGSAIAIDDKGYIFVLEHNPDNTGVIYEYSPSGILLKHHKISKDIHLVTGYGQGVMFDVSGNLYVNRLQKFYQIGKRKQNILDMLNQRQQFSSGKKGKPGNIEDNRFQIKWKNKHESTIQILNLKTSLLKKILIKTSDAFGSILFLGQDYQGSIYIETERITKDNDVHLEVRKYNSEGSILSVIEVPNDYYTTVYKKLEVDSAGNIYQLLTTPEGVKLIKWQHK